MKLIISQYLASLQERDELDAILPDLLSQMGMVVFSRPQKGTRQNGVDVAAVGKLGDSEKVYLFSIKAGDLTRPVWDGNSSQSLRPSLNEILDAYIPNRLPNEHRDKEIVICVCMGGDIQEQVRPEVEGFFRQNQKNNVSFEEWNGDKLASLIETYFLREELLPTTARADLRKSLALLDEPSSSFQHFIHLVKSLSNVSISSSKAALMAIRQINLCLWILYAWARDAGNLESAYQSSEIALLHVWDIAKHYYSKKSKSAQLIRDAFESTSRVYIQVASKYSFKLLPHVTDKHALSTAVKTSSNVDVNLEMFDVLGRLALMGIWFYSATVYSSKKHSEESESTLNTARMFFIVVKQLIGNNPTLLLPIKDDQAIDIALAVLLLFSDEKNYGDIDGWLREMLGRAIFAYRTFNQYPCIIQNYTELLNHPQKNDEAYRKKVTSGSILYPYIALWAALVGDEDLYKQVQQFKKELLEHCTFQFWYPDESSEDHFYRNSDFHGATLTNPCIDRSSAEYLEQVFGECKQTPQFESLSAVQNHLVPVILMACRHYRLPIPIQLWANFYEKYKASARMPEASPD